MDGDNLQRIRDARERLDSRPVGVVLVDLERAYNAADRLMAEVIGAERGDEPLDAYSWRLGATAAILFLVGSRELSPDVEIIRYVTMGAAR